MRAIMAGHFEGNPLRAPVSAVGRTKALQIRVVVSEPTDKFVLRRAYPKSLAWKPFDSEFLDLFMALGKGSLLMRP